MDIYYVANNGNDANPGTEQFPWRTETYALTQISRLDRVRFKRGDRFGPLLPTNIATSGTDRIFFEDYGTGPKPQFSAGVKASGWVDIGGNIWTYENANLTKVTQLTIGGAFQRKGTFPNSGYYFPTNSFQNTQITDTVNLSGTNFVGGEVVTRKERWIIDRQLITSQSGSVLNVQAVGSFFTGDGYFIQNHPDCCTQQGDWAFVASENKVYLYTTTDPNTLDIEVSLAEHALKIQNSKFLTFLNLDFRFGHGNNIFRTGSSDIEFNGCESNFSGEDGMKSFVSPRCTWEFGYMSYIGNTGIYERDTGGDFISNLIVRHSKFEEIGSIPGYGLSGTAQMMGIRINNAEAGCQVYDNVLRRIGNIGIRYSSADCDAWGNSVDQASLIVGDSGAYYFFSPTTVGSAFRKNIALNIRANNDGVLTPKNDSACYYADDNTDRGAFLKCFGLNGDRGLYIHNSEDCDYDDNYFIGMDDGIRVSDDETQGAFPATVRVRGNNFRRNLISVDAGKNAVSYRVINAYENDDPWLFGTWADNKYHRVDADSYFTDIPFTAESQISRDFAGYQAYTGLDATSHEVAFDRNSIEYFTNDSYATNTITLDGVWKDLDNVIYYGSIELEAMESVVLIRLGDLDPKQGTLLFQENWEAGTITNWENGGDIHSSYIPATGSSTIVTDEALSGTRSLRMRSDNLLGQSNNYRYQEISDHEEIIATFHLYFPTRIDLANNFDSFFNLVQFKGVNLSGDMRNDPLWVLGLKVRGGKGSGGANYLGLSYLGQNWPELGVSPYDAFPQATIDIPLAQWFKLQIRYRRAEHAGIIQVWQDDTLLFELRNIITHPSSLVEKIQMSVNNYGEERVAKDGTGTTLVQDFTDVFLDDVAIHLPSASHDYGDPVVYTYTVDVTPAGFGTAAVSPLYPVEQGDTVTLTATPAAGKQFVKWTRDGFDFAYDNPFSFTPLDISNESADLVAVFEDIPPPTYALTVQESPGAGGSTTEISTGPYEEGDTVQLNANPASGFIFSHWEIGGSSVSTSANYSFPMPAVATTITAVFVPVFTVAITQNIPAGGTISEVTTGPYEQGDTVQVQATPATGYRFLRWEEGGLQVSTSSLYMFPMPTENRSLEAVFELITFALTLSATPGGSGTLTGAGNHVPGASVSVSASPNEGYSFAYWMEGGEVISTDAAFTYTMPEADATLTAFFEASAPAGGDTEYQLTISTTPESGGTVTGAGFYVAGDTVTVVATPSDSFPGNRFLFWKRNDQVVSFDENYTFAMPAANTLLVAHFELSETSPAQPMDLVRDYVRISLTPVIPEEGIIETRGTVEFEQTYGSGTFTPIAEYLNPYLHSLSRVDFHVDRALLGKMAFHRPNLALGLDTETLEGVVHRYRFRHALLVDGVQDGGESLTAARHAWLAGRPYTFPDVNPWEGKAYLWLTTRPMVRPIYPMETSIFYVLPLETGTYTLEATIHYKNTIRRTVSRSLGTQERYRPFAFRYFLPEDWEEILQIELRLAGRILSEEILTLRPDPNPRYPQQVVYGNSLGGFDSFCFAGKKERSSEATAEVFESNLQPDHDRQEGTLDTYNQLSFDGILLRTGYISLQEKTALKDMLLRNHAYLVAGNALQRIVLQPTTSLDEKDGDFIHAQEFRARLAHNNSSYYGRDPRQ